MINAEGAPRNETIVENIQAATKKEEKQKNLALLWENNKKMIMVLARKNKAMLECDYEDLIQEGYIALSIAADKYKPDNGNNFLTYAMECIQGSMKSYANDNKRTVRIPRYIQARLKETNEVDRHNKCLRAAISMNNIYSLDKKLSDDDFTAMDGLADPGNMSEKVERKIDREILKNDIEKFAETLPEQEKLVIKSILKGYNMRETGEILGKTHKEVIATAHRFFRKIRRSGTFQDYYTLYLNN